MSNKQLNIHSLKNDEDADARVASFFAISAIMTVVMIVVWTLAPPPSVGVKEGQLAPDIIGEAHHSGSWSEFRLYDYFNHSWEEGQPGQYIFLQFMDTDCPHCWSDAEVMGANYDNWGANGDVAFITISVGMLSTSHSRAETVAFQEKGDFEGCYHDDRNCKDRSGDTAHDWPYVDDISMKAFRDYNPPGVPFHLLLSPDGTVVWNSAMHSDDFDPLHEPAQALQHHVTGGV